MEEYVKNETVGALRSLAIFGADQAGAYREHFSQVKAILGGQDIQTKTMSYIKQWQESGKPGAFILTGDAGTGKTALAEKFCESAGGQLPREEGLQTIAEGIYVLKDLSAVSNDGQTQAVAKIIRLRRESQLLICANEGVLRASLNNSENKEWISLLDEALKGGAARRDGVQIANLNRMRITAESVWDKLLDFVTRDELWTACDKCPAKNGACPMLENAIAMRRKSVRTALQTLFRFGSRRSASTIRDALSVLAWMIVGSTAEQQDGHSCEEVQRQYRNSGHQAFNSTSAFYNLVFGEGLHLKAIERSPLIRNMQQAAIGGVSDIQVDLWIRDSSRVDQSLKGALDEMDNSCLCQVDIPRGRVETFQSFGDKLATSDDSKDVELCKKALVDKESHALKSWRRLVYFFDGDNADESQTNRMWRMLSDKRYFIELIQLAQQLNNGELCRTALINTIRGLNKLTTGVADHADGLKVPEPANIFSRDLGSYRPLLPVVMRSKIPTDKIRLTVSDNEAIQDITDCDALEVLLCIKLDDGPEERLCLNADIYEALRTADELSGPTVSSFAEMAELRDFYGRLSTKTTSHELLISDPTASQWHHVFLPQL